MNLAHKRKAVSLSQTELAKLLGVTRSTVAMWESGANVPPTVRLHKLSKVLNCTIDELLEEQEETAE